MIVSSFTPSYSLLAYLFQILGTVIFYITLFPVHSTQKKSEKIFYRMSFLVIKIFSSFKPLDYSKLRGRYLITSISFRRKN